MIDSANPNTPPAFNVCLVCQVRPLANDDQECERMVRFLIFCGVDKKLFEKKTKSYFFCRKCGGRMPHGRDAKRMERDAQYF